MLTQNHVTQHDINAGRAGDCRHCPVALAIGRHLHPGARVEVDGLGIRFWIPDCAAAFDEEVCPPDEVGDFVEAFDAERPVAPFTFELEVPEWAIVPPKLFDFAWGDAQLTTDD